MFDGRHCAGVPPFPALRAVVWLAARIGAIELVSERPAIAVESRARDAEEQCALGLAHQVASQQIRAAGLVAPSAPRTVLEQVLQPLVRLVAIADWMLVQQHEVRAQAFETPVLLRLQHLVRVGRFASLSTVKAIGVTTLQDNDFGRQRPHRNVRR